MKKVLFLLLVLIPYIGYSQKKRVLPTPDPITQFPFKVRCDSGKVHITINARVCHDFNTCRIFIAHKDSARNEILFKSRIFNEHTFILFPKHSMEITYGLYLEPTNTNEPDNFYYLNLACPTDPIEQFPFSIRGQNDSIWFECKDQNQANETWRTLPTGTYLIYYKNTPPRIINKIKYDN